MFGCLLSAPIPCSCTGTGGKGVGVVPVVGKDSEDSSRSLMDEMPPLEVMVRGGRLAGLLQFFKEIEDSVEFRFHFQSRYLNYEIQQELLR